MEHNRSTYSFHMFKAILILGLNRIKRQEICDIHTIKNREAEIHHVN